MILAYSLRLVCLSLACFFLLHLALGAAVSILGPAAVRIAEQMKPRVGARVLLAIRLLPLAGAAVAVAGLCVPSYLWLEPSATAEPVGLACVAAALLSVAIWSFSTVRSVRAVLSSKRYVRNFQRTGCETLLRGEPSPVWVVEAPAPFLALAGILHPRLVISRALMAALSPSELAAALRHERAHRVSRDNFKRLFILLSPSLLPFYRGFRALDSGWAKLTEWAADDFAVDGDPRRSLTLAAALVRVARMGPAPQSSPLVTSLLADSRDLAARVERLLGNKPQRGVPVFVSGLALLLSGSVAAVLLRPATLYGVHEMLERLIR